MKTHTSQNKHRNSQKEKITHSLLSDCILLWGQFYINNQLIILNNEAFLISLGLTQQNAMSSFPHWVSSFVKSLFLFFSASWMQNRKWTATGQIWMIWKILKEAGLCNTSWVVDHTAQEEPAFETGKCLSHFIFSSGRHSNSCLYTSWANMSVTLG